MEEPVAREGIQVGLDLARKAKDVTDGSVQRLHPRRRDGAGGLLRVDVGLVLFILFSSSRGQGNRGEGCERGRMLAPGIAQRAEASGDVEEREAAAAAAELTSTSSATQLPMPALKLCTRAKPAWNW